MTTAAARCALLSLPRLYPKQRAAIFLDSRYAIIEASTKSGKTVGCIAWILDRAWRNGKPGRNYWWIAPVYPQAKIAFERMKGMLRRAEMGSGTTIKIFTANETNQFVELMNGARIWFKSAEKPDNLYGEDVYDAVFDEATRAREAAWWALRTTITATRGWVRIISNVKGRKNWVYRMARKAEAGEPGHAYAKLTAHDAVEGGVLAADEIDAAQRELPPAVFRELYLAEASDDEGNPFGLDDIAACCTGSICDGPPVAWGFDLAKSVDWTVGIGLNDDGDVCGFQRWQRPWKHTIKLAQAMIGDDYCHMDSTGVGDPIVEQLQGELPCLYGEKFTSLRKQQLMEGLATAIQQGEIGYPEGPIVLELEAFEYEYTRTGVRYTAPAGMHDDCVDALALAVACWREHRGARLSARVIGGGGDDDSEFEGTWR